MQYWKNIIDEDEINQKAILLKREYENKINEARKYYQKQYGAKDAPDEPQKTFSSGMLLGKKMPWPDTKAEAYQCGKRRAS